MEFLFLFYLITSGSSQFKNYNLNLITKNNIITTISHVRIYQMEISSRSSQFKNYNLNLIPKNNIITTLLL
jgi:hypothetical protein